MMKSLIKLIFVLGISELISSCTQNNTVGPFEKWKYIQVDSTRAKWGDWDEPTWLKYFGLDMKDITGDGFKDIVAGRYFYRNPGGDMEAKWDRIDLGANVDGMLFVDVDGDEFGDVIATALPNVYWFEANDRLGNSWHSTIIGQAPATSHVNGQGYSTAQIIPGGRPEIILATGGGIYYFEIPSNPSAGNWPVTLAAREASEQGLAVGDIDGDGLIDITAPYGDRAEPMSIGWWRNPGRQPGPWKLNAVGKTENYSADRVVVADVNGDGCADILTTEESWQTPEPVAQLFCFIQSKLHRGQFMERQSILTTCSMNSLDVGDLDQDGDFDLVTGEHKGKDKRLFILMNDSKGHFTPYVIDQGKESHLGAQLYDIDNDGDLDILSIAWDNYNFLHLWRNDNKISAASGEVEKQKQ